MADENRYNILIDAGADFVLPWIWYDSNGNPVDLTGARIEAQLRRFAESNEVYEFICTHNGQGGRILMTLPLEVTARISWPNGVYDVFVTPAGGQREKLLYGNAEVQHNVTKPVDGTFLYMIGIGKFSDLPAQGILNRLYFCYEDRKIYRWNGQNYVATSIGNGIRKIDFKERINEYIDVYKIFYDDGSTWEYQVINAVIEKIELISTTGTYVDGIVDTYRIYMYDGSTFDFQVTNGRLLYPTFDVDWDEGDLIMRTPDNFDPLSFRLDEIEGDLYVVV